MYVQESRGLTSMNLPGVVIRKGSSFGWTEANAGTEKMKVLLVCDEVAKTFEILEKSNIARG